MLGTSLGRQTPGLGQFLNTDRMGFGEQHWISDKLLDIDTTFTGLSATVHCHQPALEFAV